MSTINRDRLAGATADQVKAVWNAWDAEDLVQDALARGIVTLGCMFQEIEHPRGWLFRVASNLWIDRQRHLREHSSGDVAAASPKTDRLSLEGREAGASLPKVIVRRQYVFIFSAPTLSPMSAESLGYRAARTATGIGPRKRHSPSVSCSTATELTTFNAKKPAKPAMERAATWRPLRIRREHT
jgi:hypothetical protein